MLKNRKPLGVREVQRELNLSSHSVARYHLSKLENEGLVRRKNGKYAVSKIFLENAVKINRVLIPRFLFYAVIAIVILIVELILLRHTVVTCAVYCFTIAAFVLFALIFCVETVRVWLKGSL
ncbi:MAG: winged-helix domain-containing protein [Candidatus Bathyarchaeia archaeon]